MDTRIIQVYMEHLFLLVMIPIKRNSRASLRYYFCLDGKWFSDALLEERSASLGSKVIPRPKSYFRFSERLNIDVWFEPTEFCPEVLLRMKRSDIASGSVFQFLVNVFS